MGFDGDQHVGETPEHMGADRLALIGAGRRDVVIGRNAEVVRPEPYQPLDEADIGIDRRLVARRGFVLENLLW